MKFLEIITPAVVTVVLNILFYLIIRKKVDRSIEKFKVAYSGIFKERIDIYRELLKFTVETKAIVNSFQFNNSEENSRAIMKKLNEFNNFFRINEPFLSDSMMTNFKNIHKEYQNVFDPMYLYDRSQGKGEKWEKYAQALNKLRNDKPFKALEKAIIDEMRSDLKIDSIN